MKPWLEDVAYERMRGCRRKVRMSRGRAHAVARHYGQHPIHCNFCGWWHCCTRK